MNKNLDGQSVINEGDHRARMKGRTQILRSKVDPFMSGR